MEIISGIELFQLLPLTVVVWDWGHGGFLDAAAPDTVGRGHDEIGMVIAASVAAPAASCLLRRGALITGGRETSLRFTLPMLQINVNILDPIIIISANSGPTFNLGG